MENLKYIDNVSIRKIIIIVFIVAMLISISSIGYLIFTNWFYSAEQTTKSIAEEINNSIYNQIYLFLNVPEQINEVNHKIIANGIVDLSDEEQRDKFFTGVLNSSDPEVYSFSYGSANGEYYGARRNENGVIEIMRNNASTEGSSWYYSVNEDMTANKVVVQAGKFDPRTREWYKAAVAENRPTFSQIYKHFVMDDLAISFSCPIYNNVGELQGVLGTHILLTEIGNLLKDSVSKYNGYAVIFEKDSNNIVANSMGINNFTILSDSTLERISIDKIQKYDIQGAYEQYIGNKEPYFLYEGKEQKIYINVKETHNDGLDWVVISAIPEDLLISPVVQSINLSVILAVLALLLSLIIYIFITRRLMMPINSLLQASEAFSAGYLTKRVDIVRNDEIGRISESFNKVADKMQFLINNLEAVVKERTEKLHIANMELEENKNKLQLILDSTADAIYGMNLNGECTFCNISCIKLLGYNSQEGLLGKNMHHQIHHTKRDGRPFPIDECKIFQSIKQGRGFVADDEVFWRADGTSFDVEYRSYPQIRNGKIVGAVITFVDITERKKREEEIQYLSCHDVLTGLYNRRCFEENRGKIDIPDNLPLSVVFADINGLKMTNDIFGHAAGDELIKKSAEILKQSCRDNDLIARIGGDEFVILLPKTNQENTKKILSQIRSGFLNASVAAIKCSISLGSDVKVSMDESFEVIMTNAENAMYKDKTMNRETVNKDIIDTIVNTLHSRSPREKQHSIIVSELCERVGSALNLSETKISMLKRAGYLHDIGKIVLDEKVLLKDSLLEEELVIMQQHTVVGYRILNLFDKTLDLAELVYSHHERWNGTGYPRGLKGEQIPLISRIISIVEVYERVLTRGEFSIEERKKAAIEAIKIGAGKEFDPQIVDLFVRLIT